MDVSQILSIPLRLISGNDFKGLAANADTTERDNALPRIKNTPP